MPISFVYRFVCSILHTAAHEGAEAAVFNAGRGHGRDRDRVRGLGLPGLSWKNRPRSVRRRDRPNWWRETSWRTLARRCSCVGLSSPPNACGGVFAPTCDRYTAASQTGIAFSMVWVGMRGSTCARERTRAQTGLVRQHAASGVKE